MRHAALSRREFLRAMGTAAAALSVAACAPPVGGGDDSRRAPAVNMPMRGMGNTGATVSLLGLGGQAAIDKAFPDETAIQIVESALEKGVTYIDTALAYGWGNSELNIGAAIHGRRDDVFLATKTHRRTYNTVMSDIENSLTRLQTDHVDLYQVHNISEPSDVQELFDTDSSGRSAIDAFVRVRDEGLTRFIGLTGHHDPAQLLAVLNHPAAPNFDAILMPLNPADWHRRPFQQELLPTAVERGMAVIGMKVTGLNILWNDGLTVEECLNYTFSFPISSAIVGISNLNELEQDSHIASNFIHPLTPAEMAMIENRTTPQPEGELSARIGGDWFKVHRY